MNFIPIAILCILFFLYRRKNNKKFGIVSYLLLVYLGMGVMSLALFFSGRFQSVLKYNFEAMVYMSACFIIIFYGFFSFRESRVKSIDIDNVNLLTILEVILIAGGFSAIFFFLPFAIKGLSGDVAMNRMNNDIFQEKLLPSYGLINSGLSLFANLFVLAIVFAFVNFSRGPRYRLKANLLLISSFSYVVYILAYVGRDGVVYWMLSFLFAFLLMKDFLNASLVRRIKLSFLLLVIVLSIPFLIITIARFGSSSIDISWAIINYMGQQVKNFNDTYQVDAPLEYGRSMLPAFINWIEYIGIEVPNNTSRIDIRSYYLYQGVGTNIFKTYLGELIINFGKYGTILSLMFFAFLTRKIIASTNRHSSWQISNLILFVLLYQVVLWGVFYFRLYSANYYIIGVILLFFLFKFSPGKKVRTNRFTS